MEVFINHINTFYTENELINDVSLSLYLCTI